jgi:Cu(I)/Ag(I) efflux system membrane fusion protein
MSPINVLVCAGVALLAFWLGTRVNCLKSPAGSAPSSAPVTAAQWTCSMHPQIRQSAPGFCPICGMELVPVAADPGAAAARPLKYACAMMCLPPMDHPGKCPICGMDMVPSEEHGGPGPSGAPADSRALSEVSLSPAAQRLARLQVAPVERRFVSVEIRMVGKVDYDETRQRTITSRVPGRLDRLFVNYTGIPVKQGEHLVDLYSPDLLAGQEELIQALAAVRDAPPGTSEDLLRLRRETLEAARQKLQLWGLTSQQLEQIEERGTPSDHLTIYAPIGGIVTEKRVVEGAYVETGTEIYTIADLSRVWVKLDAYEMDLAVLHYGQEVEFETEAYPGEVFHGTIAFIDPVLNPRTRTAKVRVNVPNPDGRLKPEMFVRAVVRSQLTADGRVLDRTLAGKWICPMHPEVIAEGPQSCTDCGMPLVPAESLGYASTSPSEVRPPLVIPATAPLITGKRAVVYVAAADAPGRYEGREILLGPRAGDFYVVRDGLTEGEQVVSQGSLSVDSAVQILGRRSMMHPPDKASGAQTGPSSSAAPALATGPAPPAELSEPARGALQRLYDSYFTLQKALSRDDLKAAQEAARQLLAAVQAMSAAALPAGPDAEWISARPNLDSTASAVAGADQLPAARAAFEGLSNAMITLARRLGPARRPQVLVYHCPMAFDNRGASWLQDAAGVENPYFGSAMFTCGLLKETIGGGAPADPPGARHD